MEEILLIKTMTIFLCYRSATEGPASAPHLLFQYTLYIHVNFRNYSNLTSITPVQIHVYIW